MRNQNVLHSAWWTVQKEQSNTVMYICKPTTKTWHINADRITIAEFRREERECVIIAAAERQMLIRQKIDE